MTRIRRIASISMLLVVGLAATVWLFFGGTKRLEDRTTQPLLPASALEVVAEMDHPPGKIAVSPSGRVFLSFHPAAGPPIQVAELVGGKAVPWPSAEFQQDRPETPHFQSVASLRIDRQNRLWVLDRGRMISGLTRLLAFDLESRAVVHRYEFPNDVAGVLSAFADLEVEPSGQKIYISDSSPIRGRPALVVYDTVKGSSRRVLDGHRSVRAEPYIIDADGRDMVILGVFALTFGATSIAVDDRGEWLYYGPLSGGRLYRIRTADLDDESLSAAALESKVEDYGLKTLSEGLAMGREGYVYIGDVENSALLVMKRDRGLRTLVKDPRLRWPNGLAFGPDGWLYVACSALQDVVFRTSWQMRSAAPFRVFRVRPGT